MQEQQGEQNTQGKSRQRVIKKYPNRRLYDTDTSSYITLAEVKQLVMDSESITVVDANCSRTSRKNWPSRAAAPMPGPR